MPPSVTIRYDDEGRTARLLRAGQRAQPPSGRARAVGVLPDTRRPAPDESADVVLLLGPLYHLLERADRVGALAEVRRAVRPGGLVVAATISRYTPVLDGVHEGFYLDEAFRMAANAAVAGGIMRFADAGFPEVKHYGLQGAFWLYGDVNDWLDDPERRTLMLDALRSMESVSSLLGVSGHILTIAHHDP